MRAVTAVPPPDSRFSTARPAAELEAYADALRANGFTVHVAADGVDGRRIALGLIAPGSRVMTMRSATLEALGIWKAVEESPDLVSVRRELAASGEPPGSRRLRELVAGADVALGSVHAVTRQGELLIASASGSQFGPYAASATRVVLVVGSHKLVEDHAEGIERIEHYSLPLEDRRIQAAAGQHSMVSGILWLRRDPLHRVHVVLVPEAVGF